MQSALVAPCATMRASRVEWKSSPAVLHVSTCAELHTAQHLLLFPANNSSGGGGAVVTVSPLTVEVAEQRTVEAASVAAVVEAETAVPTAVVGEGEWTDAVDDEAMAFFGDDEEM